VLSGVFASPLQLSGQLTVPATVTVSWFTIALTAVGLFAAVALRSSTRDASMDRPWGYALLAAVALWLLGLGAMFAVRGYVMAEWLPTLVLQPALGLYARNREREQFALRALALVAILQVLVAYPVAGSQRDWATVAMAVPCAAALALGVDHFRLWRESHSTTKIGATALLCFTLVVASNQWPVELWNYYFDNATLGLPGTGGMRLDPGIATELQVVSSILRDHCDTFYAVPLSNSFYVFTGIAPLTGVVLDFPNAISLSEQNTITSAIQSSAASGKRVCILRNITSTALLKPGSLSEELSHYNQLIGAEGDYRVSIHD